MLQQVKQETFSQVYLTDREREILQLSAYGYTKCDISEHIHLSPHTVDYHIRNSMRKLGARNITATVVVAIRRGLIIL